MSGRSGSSAARSGGSTLSASNFGGSRFGGSAFGASRVGGSAGLGASRLGGGNFGGNGAFGGRGDHFGGWGGFGGRGGRWGGYGWGGRGWGGYGWGGLGWGGLGFGWGWGGFGFGLGWGGWGLGYDPWFDPYFDPWYDPGWGLDPYAGYYDNNYLLPQANYNYVPYDPGAPLPPEYDPGASAPPSGCTTPVADVPNSGQDSQPPSAPGANFATQVQLYLKARTTYTVGDYWFSGDELHYRLSDNSEHTITIEQLDVQRTVDENARHGVTFTLKPAPNA